MLPQSLMAPCVRICDAVHCISSALCQIHGYLSLVVCLIGTVANILKIVVLARWKMKAPINRMLKNGAIVNLVLILEYLIFICYMYLWQNTEDRDSEESSYASTIYLFVHAIFSQTFHMFSILRTIIVAVWRYIVVVHPQRNRKWCSLRNTTKAIYIALFVSPLLCIPNYATIFTVYVLKLSELSKANGGLMVRINFWVYGVVIKLIPCVALTVVSLKLIRAPVKREQKQQQLIPATGRSRLQSTRNSVKLINEWKANRTTRMLLACFLLFLITEIPHVILGVLSAYCGEDFFINFFNNFGDIMNMTSLLNSAISFILFFVTNSRFRSTLWALFLPPIVDKPLPPRKKNDNCDNNMNRVTQL